MPERFNYLQGRYYRRVSRACVKWPTCPERNFGDPEWVCPEHRRAVTQKNHAYRGQVPG